MTNLFNGAVGVPKATVKVALENYKVLEDDFKAKRNQAKEWMRIQPMKWYDHLLGRTDAWDAATSRHRWESSTVILDAYVPWFNMDDYKELLTPWGELNWTQEYYSLRSLANVQQSHGDLYVSPNQAAFVAKFTK